MHDDVNAGAPIGVAVSGGPDSAALLLLMHACFAGRVFAATVDHQLRAEAAQEAQLVARLCFERHIPHSILVPAAPITGNLQSAARTARYALLADWANVHQCAHIATAHHADDQLETVLMRLARGSGVGGLSGVRAVNGRIIRPLLNFTKSELIEICEAAGITAVQDPSNRDLDFDRVRMREWLAVSPGPLSAAAAVRSASALAEASEALDWMTGKLVAERINSSPDTGSFTLNPADMPRELQRRLLLEVLARTEPENIMRGSAIERGLDSLLGGQTITLGNTLCHGGALWRFTAAPARSQSKTDVNKSAS